MPGRRLCITLSAYPNPKYTASPRALVHGPAGRKLCEGYDLISAAGNELAAVSFVELRAGVSH
jgi:hypothetical protein